MVTNEERVQRYAEALYGQRHGRMLTADGETTHILRAVMAVADAEQAELRAGWRKVTSALGYGDGVTEPQIGHAEFIAEMQQQARDANEWHDHQLWVNDCAAAGHDEFEDCYEHDPVLRRSVAEAKVARVEALIEAWDGATEANEDAYPVHARVMQVNIAELRAALDGE